MNELLVHVAMLFYGTSLIGQVMLFEEKINIIEDKIELPLVIMCRLYILEVFPSSFVSMIKRFVENILRKDYRLNRKTRPPNMCWAH